MAASLDTAHRLRLETIRAVIGMLPEDQLRSTPGVISQAVRAASSWARYGRVARHGWTRPDAYQAPSSQVHYPGPLVAASRMAAKGEMVQAQPRGSDLSGAEPRLERAWVARHGWTHLLTIRERRGRNHGP